MRDAGEQAACNAAGVRHMRQNYDWDVLVERYWLPFLERVERDIKGVAVPVPEALAVAA